MPPSSPSPTPAALGGRTLVVVSPLMSGPDVVALQERLRRLGHPTGPVDGRYGVATANAVRAFQSALGLDVDGIVGPRTRAALVTAKRRRRGANGGGPVGRKALAEALRHLGTTEQPAGTNRTPFGRWFGLDGVPWCATFVSYCFAIGADYTLCRGFKGAGVYSKGCSFVPTAEGWLRATGQWRGRAEPAPGDIAILNWDGGVPDHIGIVERYQGGGQFLCIEGNTAVGDDSNGGQVLRRTRNLGQVNGFGRIA